MCEQIIQILIFTRKKNILIAMNVKTSIDSVTDQPERRKYKEADNNHIRQREKLYSFIPGN